MTSPRSRDPREIEQQLFTIGPRYLLASFTQPEFIREQELEQTAAWLHLNEALRAAQVKVPARATAAWLALLSWCAGQLRDDRDAEETRALVAALREQSAAADARDGSGSIADLWKRMSRILKAPPGPRASGASPATLRGRRWAALRQELAVVVAGLLSREPPAHLLPRSPRDPMTFGEEHFERIRAALSRQARGSGLAVIAAEPGAGKSELALAYANHELARESYDHVFVLRAMDAFRLEQDFMSMAKILAPAAGTPAELRRAALEVLETTSRWLIVCQSVADPAILLEFLPRNPDGHVLCTYWQPDGPATSADHEDADPWLKYHELDIAPADAPALLEPLSPSDAQALLASALSLGSGRPVALRELAKTLAPSRLATMLATTWLEETGSGSDAARARARAQVAEYGRRWDAAGQRIQAAGKPDHPALRAALIQLWELDDKTRWRPLAEVEEPERERAAVTLLFRLEPFASGLFAAEVLDDPAWHNGTDPLDDGRLVLLDRWRLADRSRPPSDEPYFEIGKPVRTAVELLEPTAAQVQEALAVSSHTMLRLMREHTPAGESADASFELLPQAAAVAAREVRRYPADRPLVAVELYARAGICHFALGRLRTAKKLFGEMDAILEILERDPAGRRPCETEIWPEPFLTAPHLDDLPLEAPVKRMGKLVKTLRRAGHPQQAKRLYGRLQRLVADERASDPTDDEIARLHFEGAMAAHDADDSGMAEQALDLASTRWLTLGDQRWVAAAQSFLAELRLDAGKLEEAREIAEAARLARADILAAARAPSDAARGHGELARSDYLLGRIAYVEGRLRDAESHFASAVAGWAAAREQAAEVEPREARPELPPINAISASSYHALLCALLGDVPAAEREGLQAWNRAREVFPRGHWSTTNTLSNYAQILRLGGRVAEAREQHLRALEVSERTLGRSHRTTYLVRRKCAETLLEAGSPDAALRELRPLLAVVETSTGHAPASARVWAVLGRLLVENALVVSRVGRAPDDQLLDLGFRVLKHARELFEIAARTSQRRNPGLVACLLSLSEVAIRREADSAVALASEAVALASEQSSDSELPMVAPRAKLVRAEAMAALTGDEAIDVEALLARAAHLPDLPSGRVHVPAPGDRLEVALAKISAELVAHAHGATARRGQDENGAGQELYRRARDHIDVALAPLLQQIGDQPHQLVARGYAELAEVAHRLGPSGSSARMRASNERSRDRFRPSLHVGLLDITTRLTEHRLAIESTGENGTVSVSNLAEVLG